MKKYLYLTLAGCLTVGLHAMAADPNADNSAKNAGDASSQNVSPTDQSNSPADIKMTASIRKMLMKDKSLSTNAKNVKIITINSAVTLRGPVDSDAEKMCVEKAAKKAGATTVTSQIEVKASNQ